MENKIRLTQDEYENQFYDFSTTDLCERFKEVVTKIIQKALYDLEIETGKTAEYSDDPERKTLLRKRIDELYAVYMKSAKLAFAKFEEDSRKMFAIPSRVLLDEDRVKPEQASDRDVEKLRKEVSDLEQKLISEKVFLAKCKQTKEAFEKDIEPIYNTMNNILIMVRRNMKTTAEREHPKLLELYNLRIQQFIGNTNDSNHKIAFRLMCNVDKDILFS